MALDWTGEDGATGGMNSCMFYVKNGRKKKETPMHTTSIKNYLSLKQMHLALASSTHNTRCHKRQYGFHVSERCGSSACCM